MKLKKKLLGINARVFKIPNTIQPQEYSKGSGIDGVYTFSAEPERQSECALSVCLRLAVELEL
ncbi:MAG: hypothetical protein A2729_03155 [Candidatus Buchananbacteria bacterium RIFCSPHIGHO2_01_FULL_39_14]|uniref:Uncharacterized protein n=2 Tax=Candidatus Buchananiibacteriota TaxID=1817903 RepID=A0A1G1YW45_9BACT|nr:MAG: hypothetical protein A2729_03155 [Candidatus Buchananbacteria bacterium RIFCSPHIGHO2_01_FULL_39_14]OGY49138.1 MAG: hypothetical protein A3D39_05840 [Candidatus Buchananbacteria bacterium RIFCSPHIGHO2_02_FULL_39_17]OGY55986.1 MAG: hypothetical protein A2912_03340 [Candidatus Buchananbacteria bacterium RIFCSPLOWO2_01_FULL_40_23b]